MTNEHYGPWSRGLKMVLCLGLLVAAGCVQTVNLKFTRPAEVTVSGVSTIGIEPFDDAGARRGAAQSLRQKIIAGLEQEGFYQVVDLAGEARPGQVDAVISGKVWWSHDKADGQVTVLYTQWIWGKKNGIPMVVEARDRAKKVSYHEGWGSVRVQIDLLRLSGEKEETVTTLTSADAFGRRVFGDGSEYRVPDPAGELERMLAGISRGWVKRISPHQESVAVPVAGANAEAKSLMVSGDFSRAAQILLDQIESQGDAQNDPAHHYDLGVCYEAQGQLLDAIARYEQAVDLSPNAVYAQALGRAEQLKADFLKLETQKPLD